VTTLRLWAPAGSREPIIYVNGVAGVPSTTKVYLKREGARTRAVFQGPSGGVDESSVLRAAARAAEGAFAWDELCRYAGGSRRGAGPGRRAVEAPPWAQPHASDDYDFATITPDLAGIPFKALTRIVVDDREPLEMVEMLRTARNLVVDVARLPAGDYLLPGVIAIERKSVYDFVASVTGNDPRLFKQAARLATLGFRSVILIEGDPYAQRELSISAIDDAICRLSAVHGIPILNSRSLQHSADMIARLVRVCVA
jgi:hypothetical protein